MADGGNPSQNTSQNSPAVIDSGALNDIATNSKMMSEAIGNVTQAITNMSAIILPVVNGGTGLNHSDVGGLLVGAANNTYTILDDVAAAHAFVSGGVGAPPLYGTVVLTQPATIATLTIANNKTATISATSTLAGGDGWTLSITAAKTVTISNTLTFAGTDGTTMTFPSTNANVAALNIADQTLSGGANVTSANLGTKSSGTLTIDCGTCPLQYVTNGGAFTLAAPANDGSCALLVTNNGSAGAITFSGFTVGTTGDALDTTNTHKFKIYIDRINSVASYTIKALQ